MAALAYPVALPGPWQGEIQADDRRLKSPGLPLALRAIQREVVSVQKMEFVYTPSQAAVFQSWWEDDLIFGGAWFTAPWAHPLGEDAAVERRFIGQLTWAHIPGGNWRLASEVEVRENPYGLPPTSTTVATGGFSTGGFSTGGFGL